MIKTVWPREFFFFFFLFSSIKKNPCDGVNRPEKDMLPRNLRAKFSHKMFIESASSVRTGKYLTL